MKVDRVHPGGLAATTGAAGAALIFVAFATWVRSPLLGAVGYLASLLAIIYGAGGWELLRALFPAWLTLCFIIPLPFNLDLDLITSLCQIVTGWSSHVLHLLGILQLVEGNVLQISKKTFLIADACTGTHSFFVVLAGAVFPGLLLGRTTVHILILAVCGVSLAVIENLARVTTVVLAYTWGVDISEGWAHKSPGLALFILTLLFLASADQLLVFLLPKRWLPSKERRPLKGRPETTRDRSPRSIRILLAPLATGVAILGIARIGQFPVQLGGDRSPECSAA